MRQIFVDSRDRVSGTSTDFVIQLPQTLPIETKAKGRIDNLRVPITIPTVRTGVNDTLSVNVGGLNYTAILAQSNYSGPGLAAAVQLALSRTTPGTWQVTYDANNVAMTMTCSINYQITGGTFGDQLFSHGTYTQVANSYTFNYVPVQGLDMLYLSSSRFSTLDTVGPSGAHDTLMCAVVTTPFGSVLDASMPTGVNFEVPMMTTQQLDFQLRDRHYNVISIVPNISFVLLIDE